MPEMDRASYVCFGPKYSLFLQMSRELRDLHNQKTQPGNTNHFTGVTSNEQLTKYFRARLVRSLLSYFGQGFLLGLPSINFVTFRFESLDIQY